MVCLACWLVGFSVFRLRYCTEYKKQSGKVPKHSTSFYGRRLSSPLPPEVADHCRSTGRYSTASIHHQRHRLLLLVMCWLSSTSNFDIWILRLRVESQSRPTKAKGVRTISSEGLGVGLGYRLSIRAIRAPLFVTTVAQIDD